MANTNTEIIAMLETNPSQAIRGVLDTLYLYNPATVNDLIAQLNDVINKVGFEAIVVDALPETGKKGTIYFVPSGGETPNVYNEYVWVTETEKFEMVGSAQVDLSNYYTKDEIDNQLIDIVGYVGDETRPIRNDLNQLNQNTIKVANWVNAKDEEGNRAVLETEAQDAFRAINELNAKIGSGGGGASLPDQTDNAGKFLMTDGATASWSDKPLVNNADNESSKPYAKLSIGGNSNLSTAAWYTAVGNGAYVSSDGGIAIGGTWEEKGLYAAHAGGLSSISIGYDCEAVGRDSIAIGNSAYANKSESIAIGAHAEATATNAIAIGGYSGGTARAKATAECAIQLGCGTDITQDCTNSDANTLKVANNNGNFEIMSADGTIPTDRYTTTPTSAGTYVPKLTIAEDGTTTREWGTASGGGVSGDYLPLSGGTLTGALFINQARLEGYYSTLYIGTSNAHKAFSFNLAAGAFEPQSDTFGRIGMPSKRWAYVHTTKLNNGADLIVPTEGGTLARLEDLSDITTVTIKEYD